MRAGDESFERLRAALDELAVGDVAELLAEARVEARARVRSMLSDALAHSMLEEARKQLSNGPRTPSASPPRAPAPGPRAPAPARARSSEPASAPRGRPPRRTGELAWYVYGVIGTEDASAAAGLEGIGGAGVMTVSEDELTALASRVPREEFDEAELRAHLSDMTWVETVARRHETVLDQLCKRTTVIPMRMCTVYRTEDGVREMLRREATALGGALEHLEGKQEWGVQTFFFRESAHPVPDAGPESAADSASASTGAAYMQRRRQERDLEEQLGRSAEEAAGEIHGSLEALSSESILNPPQRSEATGRRDEMVLNGVYLVEESTQELFHDEVRDLQERFASVGLELITTGPWPPYNFLPGEIGAAW